jgi:cleavage and polyadenylation specificity factor subunit 3
MSPNVRSKFARGINPFDFKRKDSFIRPLDRGISKLNDKNPCVVMASPGFLTNGVSRELLERWAPDPRNGLIITGYSVEGVMARVRSLLFLLSHSDESLIFSSRRRS